MAYMKLNLHMFEGDGGGAGAAPAAGGGEGGEAAAVAPGTLNDGTVVDNRLAARMEEQARKRRDRGEDPVVTQPGRQPVQGQQPEPSLDDQWMEAKKGKFRDQYARDVQAAIRDRFKNQEDANQKLAKLEPALKALARQRGVDENDLDELTNDILNDDSLYEEEAEKAGMTVEGYRNYQQMLEENRRMKAQEAEEQEQLMLRRHFQNLARQAEDLKQKFPGFDLRREMENERFRRLVAPNSGLGVADAYFAIHHDQIGPQAMVYGFQRAQQQISQTLQANRARPVEGAIKGGQPANVSVDPRSMTREERQKLIERSRRGEKIVF